MKTHVAEALNDHRFALEFAFHVGALHVLGMTEKFLQTILHAATGRLCAAMNPAHFHRLSGYATKSINI